MKHARVENIVMLAEFAVKPDRLDEFLAYTVENLAASRSWPGNIAFDILLDETDPTAVRFYEVWESRAAQQAYFAWRVDTGDLNRLLSFVVGTPKFTALRSIAAPPSSD